MDWTTAPTPDRLRWTHAPDRHEHPRRARPAAGVRPAPAPDAAGDHEQDGSPQVSPVTGGVDAAGRIVVSTYPDRAKVTNLRRRPAATVLVLSDEWDDAWVQIDGTTEVIDMPDQAAEDGLVEYFRCISGEHPDWDEYRAAMRRQGKTLLRITPASWGRSRPEGSRRTAHPPERPAVCASPHWISVRRPQDCPAERLAGAGRAPRAGAPGVGGVGGEPAPITRAIPPAAYDTATEPASGKSARTWSASQASKAASTWT